MGQACASLDSSSTPTFKKPREVEHDIQVYRAYECEAVRLQERGARIEGVVLDYELKRGYQQFLQERNRGRADSDGGPIATSPRSRNGRTNTTCRTTKDTCTSRMRESITWMSTAVWITSTSRS